MLRCSKCKETLETVTIGIDPDGDPIYFFVCGCYERKRFEKGRAKIY